MRLIIVFIHLAVCIALIMIVLLQKGKGASMGAAFGGSSQTVFGSAGASSFLQKVTVAAAVVFMLTSLTLALLFGRGASTSVMRGVSTPMEAPATQQTEGAFPAAPPVESQAPADTAKE